MRPETDLKKLEQLGQVFAGLSGESDSSRLPAAILSAALELTGADAGALYLSPAPGHLCCEAVEIVSLDIARSGDEAGDELPMLTLPTEAGDGQSLLLTTFLENRPFLVESVASCCDDLTELKQFDAAFKYQSEALLSVPLSGMPDRSHGVLQLMNPATGSFSGEDRLFALHLATSAGCSLRKHQQLEEQRALFEATIQMIAGAVDEKFYFGADHCRRVPVLTMMLAQAVNRSSTPPFAEQQFSAAELYELEVAAWLHDCGKLVTPINLVDKSRKLETIFDRIELIQTRFEIIRRDEEIARLRAGVGDAGLPVLADGEDRSQLMWEDLHFLTDCNHGKKQLTAADQERVQQIAERYRWVDRQMEEVSVLTDDELANLSIASGTINERERIKINNHAMATIGMLDLLSFPEELQRVPEIISGYHGQDVEQPLLQARILAVADMFVSVTAENRTYRETNDLEQALQILFELRDAGRLDGELLDLFVQERLHQQYAAEFLSQEQSGFDVPD